LRVELHDAVFVGGLGARRAACAFGIDDELAPLFHALAPDPHGLPQRLGPASAIDGDHAHLRHIPAEERDPHQLALEDVNRVRNPGQECDRIPERLMLRRDDARSVGQILLSGDFHTRAGQHLMQPQAGGGPSLWNEPGALARQQEIDRHPENHLDDQVRVKREIEG